MCPIVITTPISSLLCVVNQALEDINEVILGAETEATLSALTAEHSGIHGVDEGVAKRYHQQLKKAREEKGEVERQWEWLMGITIQCCFFVAFNEGRNIRCY